MKLTLTLVFVTMAAWASVLCGASAEPLPQPEAQPEAPVETRSRFAGLDDVRLLANGLLQLGQSLREFVHKTKGQINDIFQKLNNFDYYFNQLSNMASEIKEEEEELKKTTVVLKANNDQLKNQSLEISYKVENILQERMQLQSTVGGLEQRVRSLSQGMVSSQQLEEITALRELSQTQEQSIIDLLRAVKEQSEQLNHQRMKIKILEEKLPSNTLVQETVERMTDISVSETPTLTPFLSTEMNVSLPSDCSDLFDRGERLSGVYAIRPKGHEGFMVYCDMIQDGGSTVIQRRKDGSVNFDQTWEEYENGFGDFQGEFWLGLKKIYSLASDGDRLLHVQLEDWRQGRRFIEYSFSLEGPASGYTIHLTQPSGDLSDAMINHTGMRFSTKDRDNDNHQDFNCALDYTGGWWFNACGDTNLNGRYTHIRPKGRSERRRGIQWRPSRRTSYSLRHTQMSIGPVSARRPAVATTPASTDTGNFI